MTSPGSPVTLVPGFALQPASLPDPVVVQLYALQTTAPERIESVYMTLYYADAEPTFQSFAIQLRDIAGNVLYEQPTPVFTAMDTSNLTMVLCWSRLGNDSAQEPAALLDDGTSGFSRMWANMRLPDLVLAPGATVQLVSWSFFETSSGTVPVDNCTVTTTRDAGAVSDTSQVTGIPLYTDISTG